MLIGLCVGSVGLFDMNVLLLVNWVLYMWFSSVLMCCGGVLCMVRSCVDLGNSYSCSGISSSGSVLLNSSIVC